MGWRWVGANLPSETSHGHAGHCVGPCWQEMLFAPQWGPVSPIWGQEHLTTLLSPVSLCSPTYCKVVPGEGMPLLKDPRRRGDLLIHFNVCFPTRLTPNKKMLLRSALLS